MKKAMMVLFGYSIFLAACSSNNKPENSSDRIDTSSMVNSQDTTLLSTNTGQASGKECFVHTNNKDTASLTLVANGKSVSGELTYRLYEKDRNQGTISGELKGDTIIADYTFQSEGQTSVREVAFLRKDGKLYEGFGDVAQSNGKVIFKDRSKLKFDQMVFTKTNCN